jgi:uncharacterized membrane protein
MDFLLHYAAVAGIFIAIDAVWLTVIASKFYKKQLGDKLKPKADLVPAVIFYLLYVAGIVVFALNPALGEESLACAAGYGGFLGLLMYATYDLTNQSTLKDWPVKVTIVDLIWGSFVTALTTVLAFLIFN